MWLVIIILILLLICSVIFIIYSNNDKNSTTVDEDLYRVQEYFIGDNNLQRMLMIEILTSTRQYTNYNTLGTKDIIDYTSSKSDDSLLANSQSVPENITYNRILISLKKLSICLTRYLGGVLSKRLILLLQRRHEILRDFYVKLNKNLSLKDSRSKSTVWDSENCSDIATDTLSKLKNISEIMIADIKSVICNNRDISYYNIHYRHLLDLFNMYDIEILNQAKSYNIGDYNISLNNFNGSKVIAQHISDELKTILKYNQKQLTNNIS